MTQAHYNQLAETLDNEMQEMLDHGWTDGDEIYAAALVTVAARWQVTTEALEAALQAGIEIEYQANKPTDWSI